MIVTCHCVTCRSDFSYDHVGRGRYRRTCSPACQDARKLAKARDYRREGHHALRPPRPKTIPKTCAVCRKSFMAAERRRKACGPVCGGVLAKRNGDIGRRRNAEKRRRRICEGCGSEFVMRNPSGQARAGRSQEGRFCSRACAVAGRRIKCEAAE